MDWFRKSAIMWPPNPRSLLSQNGEVGAMGHFQPSQPAPVAPQQCLPMTIDGSSITSTAHQPSALLATGSPSGTASSQSISTKPARKQYGLVQPEPVAPKQTLPTMTDSSSSSGASHQPSAPSKTGSPSCTASSQYISMEAAGKQNGLAQAPMAPQQTLLMMTDSYDSSSTSHQPSAPLAIGGPSGTVSLQSTSMKLARKQYGLVRENGVTRIIPSPTSIYLAKVQSKEPNSSIPSPSSMILERAMRILKSKSIKIPQSSQKRAAHQRLRKIMLPLEEEDPGIGDGDFLHLRSGVIPIRPATQRTTTLSHSNNRGGGIDGDNASRGGDVLPEPNSPHHSQNMMPHLSDNGGGSNGDDAFLLTAGDIPTGPITSHPSHTTMTHPSSNEGGGSNGDGAILLRTGDVLKELTTRRLSQNMVPHPSRNEGGDNINGDDAFLLSIGDVSTGPSTPHIFQTTTLLHSDNEGGSSNGEDTFLLSAGDASMGPNILHLSQTMMPHLSNSEGGGGQGDNASLYDGRESPTEPTIPQPMQAMTLQHSDQECTNSSNGSDTFYCSSTHFLQSPSGMLNRSWLPSLDEVPWIHTAPARLFAPVVSLLLPLPSNTELPEAMNSTPLNTETPGAVISTPSNTEHPGATTSKRSNTEPWGPMISTSANRELLVVMTSTPSKETYNENQTDTKSRRHVGHMKDSCKAFQETLDWLQEEYEIVSELLFYTEEQWAIADAVAKKYKNQLDEVPWIRANPQKLSAPVISLVLPSPSSTESPVVTTSTPSNTETLGAMISTPSNIEQPGAMTSKPSNTEPWGAMISTTPNKELLGATTYTPSKEPYSENQTDPKSQGYAGQMVDGRKALREMLDWLQEEYEIVCELLYYTKEQWAIADAVAQKYENQSAFESAGQTKDVKDEEIIALREEVEYWKDQLVIVLQQLKEKENEAQSLRSNMRRFFLSEEEMEEVIAKRCWLSRYWGLALHYDLFPGIAKSKHEHWAALAPIPLELVISIGEKTKEDFENQGNDNSKRSKLARDVMKDIKGKLNMESMLAVEKGLRELTFLKVEEAVVLEMSNHNRAGSNSQFISGYGLPSLSSAPSLKLLELSDDEADDVHFKRAWLIFFWARAVIHGVENDIAEDRLQYWISRTGRPTLQDAVTARRDMLQLRELEIELQQ